MRRMSLADAAILALGLALTVAAWAAFAGRGAGQTAVVSADGQVVARLPLDRPARVTVPGPLGETVVEVHDGAVRFLSSPCTRQMCVHSGWLRAGGAFAACLPNRVSVRVAALDDRYDSINF